MALLVQSDLRLNAKQRMKTPLVTNSIFVSNPPLLHKIQPNKNSSSLLSNAKVQIYDPNYDVSVTKGPYFSSEFESGNLGKVFQINKFTYDINILQDPGKNGTTQWFYFKVESIPPGYYTFILHDFYKYVQLHSKGSLPCVLSMNGFENGIGWQRLGEKIYYFRLKCSNQFKYALSFSFQVKQTDTMYFAYSYPYTYTDLRIFLKNLPKSCCSSTLCYSPGHIEVPAIFWDADIQKCVPISQLQKTIQNHTHRPPNIRAEKITEFNEIYINFLREFKGKDYPQVSSSMKKPVIVIVGRVHSGEPNGSYAVEGFMKYLFETSELRANFSFLIVPMLNVDGVICGLYRTNLIGEDMNRIWGNPHPKANPEAQSLLELVDNLRQTRPIAFFLDFHGHGASFNSFVFGFGNETNQDLSNCEKVFPYLMSKNSNHFDFNLCDYRKQPEFEGTMRVVFRRKFLILFSYTLEMSFGGCDFGAEASKQFTPQDYRSIGQSSAQSIYEMFSTHPSRYKHLLESKQQDEHFYIPDVSD